MNKPIEINEYIEGILKSKRLAVLATEGDGQPHASLIAITPYERFRQLIFATYRNTLKFRNITNNKKVAVLFESSDIVIKGLHKRIVLTIIGHAEEISRDGIAFQAHAKEHPEMESFMLSSDCALILVIAQSYQVVLGVDDIRWIKAEDLDPI
jgi:hypothetical protein